MKGAVKPFKYPNIELKRCFDAAQFRRSNKRITTMATERANSMRSLVKTTVPRKHRNEDEGPESPPSPRDKSRNGLTNTDYHF